MIDQSFKKGDKIVRFGRVFEIFKIQAEKNSETGESERLMYFRPVYETLADKTLICSIPINNVDQTNIRRPMSDEQVDDLLTMLVSKIEVEDRFNTRLAKEVLKSNDPGKIALILKKLAIVERDPDTNFTYTKKRVFSQGLKRLQEEIALVKKISLEEACQKLIKLLKRQAVKSFPIEIDECDSSSK